jgi:hypothetical protein
MPIGAASSRSLAARRWNAHRFTTVSERAKYWLLLKNAQGKAMLTRIVSMLSKL